MAALDEHPPFSVRDDSDDGPLVLAVAGELDLSVADELVSAIERVAKPSDSLCLDLGACGFVDSTGLKVLVQTARRFRAAGGELYFYGPGASGAYASPHANYAAEGSPVFGSDGP